MKGTGGLGNFCEERRNGGVHRATHQKTEATRPVAFWEVGWLLNQLHYYSKNNPLEHKDSPPTTHKHSSNSSVGACGKGNFLSPEFHEHWGEKVEDARKETRGTTKRSKGHTVFIKFTQFLEKGNKRCSVSEKTCNKEYNFVYWRKKRKCIYKEWLIFRKGAYSTQTTTIILLWWKRGFQTLQKFTFYA